MTTLRLSELKRFTHPYLSEADEAEANAYWSQQPREARVEANTLLMREFCRERGTDVDQPQPCTTKRRTLGDPDPEAEQWDRDFEAFLRRH